MRFQRRERLLTALAIVLGVIFGGLTFMSGFILGAVWLIFCAIGSLLFISIGGRDRCFYTALFNGIMTIGLIVALVLALTLGGHERLTREHFILFGWAFGGYFVLPVLVAWVVTRIASRFGGTD
jgi:hypothetical protein